MINCEDLLNLQTFCYRCKKTTKFEDETYFITRKGKLLIKGYCVNCKVKKSFLTANEINFEFT